MALYTGAGGAKGGQGNSAKAKALGAMQSIRANAAKGAYKTRNAVANMALSTNREQVSNQSDEQLAREKLAHETPYIP